MRRLVDALQNWDFRICGVFLIDSQFVVDASKFFSGVMSALSTMVQLEIPHVNIMSKMDLLDGRTKIQVERLLKTHVIFSKVSLCALTLWSVVRVHPQLNFHFSLIYIRSPTVTTFLCHLLEFSWKHAKIFATTAGDRVAELEKVATQRQLATDSDS